MTPTDQRVHYQPSPIGEASVRNDDGRLTLVFVKDLAHPPESVWAALTDPDELREWAPFDAPRSLAVLGPVTLVMAGGDGTEHSPAVVTRAEAPRLLEYTWEKDFLRWELAPTRNRHAAHALAHGLRSGVAAEGGGRLAHLPRRGRSLAARHAGGPHRGPGRDALRLGGAERQLHGALRAGAVPGT